MMNKKKSHHRHINGILLLDKPKGMTSNAALQHVKHLYNASKAGHTGSLDPLASGMLPLCFGEATKFSQFLLEADKRYFVVCKLGVTTTTDDAEGEIITTKPCASIDTAQIEKILQQFRGQISQLPPMHSAIKRHGQPLYKLARQGITVDRELRKVNIYELTLVSYHDSLLEIVVHCSKGTYVRTLAGDIGKALGCGAHVVDLRRLAVGSYEEKDMAKMETLETLAIAKDYNKLDALLLPIEAILYNYPEVTLSETTAYYLIQGQPVMVPKAPPSGLVRLKTKDGKFLGAGEILDDGRVAPRRLINVKT